jgi:hypothetical protein
MLRAFFCAFARVAQLPFGSEASKSGIRHMMRVARSPLHALPEFEIGDRVRLSSEGVEATRSSRAGYMGKVVRVHTQTSISVLFDGNRRPTRLYAGYLERDPAAELSLEGRAASRSAGL